MGNPLTVNIKNYEKILKEFDVMETKAKKAVQRTVNDFKTRGPGWVSQEVAKEYNIKKKDINEARAGVKKAGTIKVQGVEIDNLSIIYSGPMLSVNRFNMKPKTPPPFAGYRLPVNIDGRWRMTNIRKPVNLTAEIKKGKRKRVKGDYSTPIFISNVKGGAYIPFQKVTKVKNDTKEKSEYMSGIKSVSIPQMITNKTVSTNIQKRMNQEMQKRLEHNLKQMMKK